MKQTLAFYRKKELDTSALVVLEGKHIKKEVDQQDTYYGFLLHDHDKLGSSGAYITDMSSDNLVFTGTLDEFCEEAEKAVVGNVNIGVYMRADNKLTVAYPKDLPDLRDHSLTFVCTLNDLYLKLRPI